MKVGILNNYLSTFGGGEKDTYVVANRLSQLGIDVEIFSFEEKVPTQSEIDSFFGRGHSGFAIRQLSGVSEKARDKRLKAALKDCSVFINHCAGSSFVNPCPVGIYSVMFPAQQPGPFLRSYQHFICNSEFTRFYCGHLWGQLPATVMYPCCDDKPGASGPRAKEILSIGRFNWRGHKKNQDLLVGAFEQLLDKLPGGWRLVMLGKMNDGHPETRAHFEALRARSSHLPVAFEVNAGESRKRELLSRAAIFWHGTGIGSAEPDEAALMEHFGIAVVEAMRAGAVPLCYKSGGPAEIIEHGKSGFLYRDLDELKTFTLLLAQQAPVQERFKADAIERAGHFSRSAFNERFDKFFHGAVAA